MNRKECLEAAGIAVLIDRETDYGSPEDTFSDIAELWTSYLHFPVSAKDVAHMMILLKIARAKNNPKEDNYVDIAGYAACAAEIGGEHE